MSNLGKFSHSVEVGGKAITLETGVMVVNCLTHKLTGLNL